MFEYHFDQDNPWSPKTHGAHHACDLLYWFNGYNLPSSTDQKVSDAMKEALVRYINGEEPWPRTNPRGFGPGGFVGAINDANVRRRRRVDAFKVLDKLNPQQVLVVAEYKPPPPSSRNRCLMAK